MHIPCTCLLGDIMLGPGRVEAAGAEEARAEGLAGCVGLIGAACQLVRVRVRVRVFGFWLGLGLGLELGLGLGSGSGSGSGLGLANLGAELGCEALRLTPHAPGVERLGLGVGWVRGGVG